MTKGMKYPPFARPGATPRIKTPVAAQPVEEALPSIDEFLDDLPSIDDYLASDPPEISHAPAGVEEFDDFEEPAQNEEGWAAGDWQSFDWSSAASLNRNTSSAMDSSNAWSDSDWPEPVAQYASVHPTADEIADALTGIAHRIRSGELVIDKLQDTPPEAAMAAALAVLLRMRG